MGGWIQDVRLALRAVGRQKLVSGLAIAAFALGIGVTTAVFSIFNAVLLTPLAYPESDRLVAVYDTQPACATCPASFPKYHDWRARGGHLFKAIGGSSAGSLVLTGLGDPERVSAVTATATLVDVLGVAPARGRWYTDEEDRPGGPNVAVVSHTFWQTRLGGDTGVLSRSLTLNGKAFQIIGVMPEGFAFRGGLLFVPVQRRLDPATRGSHFMQVHARLNDGVTVERATTEMRAAGRELAVEFGHNHGIDVRPYFEVVVGGIRSPLQILMAAVVLVLLIACANVANLLLAAGLARRRELAIRLAMGARRAQLARLLVSEGMVLAALGGALGVLLAHWAVKVFVALAGSQLPRGASVHINGQVLVFAAGLSLSVGLLCGMWPLLRMKTRELAATVREADTRTVSVSGGRFGSGLVVAEIAIACALLVGAGLLVKNLMHLQGRDTGMRTEDVIAFGVPLTGPRYAGDEGVRAFYRELLPRLAAVGGVVSAGATSHLPMVNFGFNGEMMREGGNPWGPNEAPLVEYRWFAGDYFNAIGVPLLQGRAIDGRDKAGSRTVLINKRMADLFWPGENPIGRRFGQGRDQSNWYEVVGVVGDIRSFGLTRDIQPEFYRSVEQSASAGLTVVLRTGQGDSGAVMPAARQIVASIDASLPITAVQRMTDVVTASTGLPRFVTALSTLFGALAGLLAMVGVYGVMIYNVRRQRREFGIRLALGADAAHVRRLVMGRSLTLAGMGVTLGLFGAFGLSRWLASQLTEVPATDPALFAAIAIGVLVVACLSSWIPARQASRVDPGGALRDS